MCDKAPWGTGWGNARSIVAGSPSIPTTIVRSASMLRMQPSYHWPAVGPESSKKPSGIM